MSHCKKVKLLYVGNECTDSYCCYYSYEKNEHFWKRKSVEFIFGKRNVTKSHWFHSVHLCCQMGSAPLSLCDTSLQVICTAYMLQTKFSSQQKEPEEIPGQEVVLPKQCGCGEPCPLNEALHLSGTDVCLLVWGNKAWWVYSCWNAALRRKALSFPLQSVFVASFHYERYMELLFLPRPSMELCQDTLCVAS